MGKKKQNKHICKLPPYEVEPVLTVQDAKQRAGWNITAFDLPKSWRKTGAGAGVLVAVIDSGCDLNHPDLKNNLVKGKNFVNPRKPPHDDNQHGCVSPTTSIHTNFCGVEQIETLYNRLPQEELLNILPDHASHIKDVRSMGLKTYSINTSTGETEIDNVEFVHKTKINQEIVEIELEGKIPLKLTPWHPVYTFSNVNHGKRKIIKKRADELQVGDKLKFPDDISEELVTEPYRIKTDEYFVCSNCGHVPNYIKSKKSQCKKCNRRKWITRFDEYLLEEDLAYIVGIVATDGHIVNKNNRYRISVTSDTPEILSATKSKIESLGFKCRTDSRPNRTDRLICDSKKLVFMLQSVGLLTEEKTYKQHLPEFVGKSPKRIIYSFLAGVIDGDGCISKSNTGNRITTVSESFAKGLTALMNSIGISCGVQHYKNVFKGVENKSLPIINCTFSKVPIELSEKLNHPVKKERSSVNNCTKTRKTRRIKSVNKVHYDGFFYDFTVKNNHTYVAEGHFVSNTHVAGIIAAEHNDIGMVGVAPKANIMPIKVLDRHGSGSLENTAKGIRWAVDNGADIICMSLGAPMKLQQVRKAVQYANSKGVPCFVAAGNAGRTKEVFYPAAYPETIAVGSIDQNFNRSNFSNTGKNLDFMAPGGSIFSTVPDDWYAVISGTSMACPFAVGVAALVLSWSRKKNNIIPLNNAEDYRKVFREHTIPIKDKNYGGKKFFQGYGIIDPRKFMEHLKEVKM
jgi:subtilisin family serine protease